MFMSLFLLQPNIFILVFFFLGGGGGGTGPFLAVNGPRLVSDVIIFIELYLFMHMPHMFTNL